MSVATRPPLVEQLPAVLAESDFVAALVAAFERAFAPIRAELDALPTLYGAAPTARLATRAARGSRLLRLDSAAGFVAGDVVQLEDVRHPSRDRAARVEFATVAEIRLDAQPVELGESLPDPLPRALGLAARLRLPHVEGASVRLVGQTSAAAAALGEGAPAGTGDSQAIAVAGAAELFSVGDVIRVDDEYAQVAAVDGASVTIVPPLAAGHPIGSAVTLLAPPATTTPAASFGRADRAGAELVLAADADANQSALELDTLAGIRVGDLLQLVEADPARIEFVRVGTLPADDPRGPGIDRRALRLHQTLRHAHAAGTPVAVVDDAAAAGETALAAAAGRGSHHVFVGDLRLLGVAAGDVVAVGTGASRDHAQVVETSANRLTLAPPLHHDQPAAAPVVRLVRSGGTGFLAWLAGWLGVELRPDRGERWNAELLRLAGTLAPWRGTRRGVEAWVRAALRGEADARVLDLANPLRLGVSRLGVDAVLCGNPHFFGVEVETDPRASRTHHPQGIAALVEAVQATLARERPAFADYDVRLCAHTMQLGVDARLEVGARLGETTLLWSDPLVIPGDEERRG